MGMDTARAQKGILSGREKASTERLIDTYRSYFDVVHAERIEQRRQAYRLRYQVYCLENEFESREEHQDGLEHDSYDDISEHILLQYRGTGEIAGTARLIIPGLAPGKDAATLPMEYVCSGHAIVSRIAESTGQVAEVSRFAISKLFRRRLGESQSPFAIGTDKEDGDAQGRRIIPHITLGLIQGLVRMSREHEVRRWCALMEPALLRLLGRLGIHFLPVGPMVRYHGKRLPCYIDLAEMFEVMLDERPDVWEVVTDQGRLTS